MAKYVPIPDGIEYHYDETANAEKIIIKSYWKVELSTNEDIEVQHSVDTHSHIYYVELYVKAAGGAAGDHTWQGSAETEICADMVYDPAATTQLPDQQNAVRTKILSLLNFYHFPYYEVIANVTQDNSITGNTGSNTISGSGVIEIL